MDAESLVAEDGNHVIPPPLFSPIPPPIALAVASKDERSILWRWNDRLAVVVGGLTLVLLGVIGGRVFQPEAAGHDSGEDIVAAADLPAPQSLEGDPLAGLVEAGTQEEINPPELAFAPPAATPDVVAGESVSAVPHPAAPPTPLPKPVAPAEQASASREDSQDPEESAPLPAIFVSSPVSLEGPVSQEGKVASIKLPATTQVCSQETKSTDRKLGTALIWAESVSEATQQAEEEEKLIFLIHVSGNFEMPGFT